MSVWVIGLISASKRGIMNLFGFPLSKSVYDDAYEDAYGGYNWKQANRQSQPQALNVHHFKITEWYEHGIYLVVKVNYPSAKHYEGNKVLVYEGIRIEELQKLAALDPHFSENKSKPSPIARFEPSDEGWVNAMKFCSMLHSERLELAY